MTLFEGSFTPLWNFAQQNLEFKMEILEAFVIAQVKFNVLDYLLLCLLQDLIGNVFDSEIL